MAEIEKGLVLFSQKKVVSAEPSFLHFPRADVHIKSGAILNEEFYVIKVASGFYDNPKLGIPSTDGLMLLFSQKTGELKSIFKTKVVKDIDEIAASCNLIVTGTSSNQPLIFGEQLSPGTHVTAVGADDYGKQELDVSVFEKADLIVVDSLSQCSQFGDFAHVKHLKAIELGAFIESPEKRESHWITVADLTGIAIEDLQVAKAIYSKLHIEKI